MRRDKSRLYTEHVPYLSEHPERMLRGPLSQFLSGIFLKPLDDAFNNMDVTYLRYQDDILILCKTKRQLNPVFIF